MAKQLRRVVLCVAIIGIVMLCGHTVLAQRSTGRTPGLRRDSSRLRSLFRRARPARQPAGRLAVPVSVVDREAAAADTAVPDEQSATRTAEDRRRLDPRQEQAIDQAHAATFIDDPFPSAEKCRNCHPGHYREWASSMHAYGQLSPVFGAMNNAINGLTNGTNGDFCIRCHNGVGMAVDEPVVMSNMDRRPASREGVTCVVCHRVDQNWGKGAGRRALTEGDVAAPIVGPGGNAILADVLANPETFGALSGSIEAPNSRARVVHGEVTPRFFQSTSSMCASCHDVLAPTGFRLEDAFSEFKNSPAAREKGQSCQDCHMGKIQGVAAGYAVGPAAQVGNVSTPPRKRTNHAFAGPDYSIVHPGLFPHNPEAIKEENPDFIRFRVVEGLATMREWLGFDHEAGWGTVEFENEVAEDYPFPEPWKNQARRFRARDILNDQFKALEQARSLRHQVLRAGYKLGEIEDLGSSRGGISFRALVSNGTDGHGVPTGFDAERLVFVRVAVIDREGVVVFVSGDFDPNGDVRDSHSVYVHNGEVPLDRQLFSLQTKFITRNVFGGEREQVLAIPYSLTPLVYVRPATRPFNVLGRPLGARKHKQNLSSRNGARWANYKVSGRALTGNGPYRIKMELVSGMVPVNLVHAISPYGFDYDLSAREVADRVVAGHTVIQQRETVIDLDN